MNLPSTAATALGRAFSRFPRARALAVTLLLAVSPVHAGLDVAPTRLFIDDGERAAALVVINRSDSSRMFRVIVTDTVEHEDGSRELLKTPGSEPHHAASMIRYAPRQATIAPGERQTVRLQVRRPPDLDEGEYRARVIVQTLPPAPPPSGPGEGDDGDGVTIRIETLFAVSLPIAITHGQPRAEVSLEAARATEDGLEIVVGRSGDRSVYGGLTLYAGDMADPPPLAQRDRAVVVVPLERRRFLFPDLHIPPGDSVHAVYEALEDRGGGVKSERTLIVE